MERINGYNSALRSIEDMQETLRKMSRPWYSEMEQYRKVWESLNHSIYGDAMKSFSELSKFAQAPGYSSFFIPLIDDDVAVEIDPLSDEAVTEEVATSAIYSTRAVDVNKLNQEDLEFFRTRSKEVANAILSTDFEDGMDNDVIELIRSYIKKNKSATYNWLNELYSKNLKNSPLIEGLLRTLAMVTERGDENSLLPIVISGLRSGVASEQESAIMVIEEWRTKECLDALKTTQFSTGWIKTYAEKVMHELEEEV